MFGKGSIFDSERGLKRHQQRCVGCVTRSRVGTRSERAMEKVKQKQKAAEEEPVIMEGDGKEEEKISYVADANS